LKCCNFFRAGSINADAAGSVSKNLGRIKHHRKKLLPTSLIKQESDLDGKLDRDRFNSVSHRRTESIVAYGRESAVAQAVIQPLCYLKILGHSVSIHDQ